MDRVPSLVEINLDEFPEPGGVEVAHSLRIAEGFENRIGVEYFVLNILG
jgi:hypothetical protein